MAVQGYAERCWPLLGINLKTVGTHQIISQQTGKIFRPSRILMNRSNNFPEGNSPLISFGTDPTNYGNLYGNEGQGRNLQDRMTEDLLWVWNASDGFYYTPGEVSLGLGALSLRIWQASTYGTDVADFFIYGFTR